MMRTIQENSPTQILIEAKFQQICLFEKVILDDPPSVGADFGGSETAARHATQLRQLGSESGNNVTGTSPEMIVESSRIANGYT